MIGAIIVLIVLVVCLLTAFNNDLLYQKQISERIYNNSLYQKQIAEKMYSEEEFLEFSEWVSHNDWVYLPSKGYWVNEEQEELEQKIKTKELFEQFKKKL